MGKKHLQMLMDGGAMGKVYALNGWAHFFVLACVISTIFLTNSARATSATGPTVLFTADRQGELSTCGCSLDQLGGFARLPAALKSHGITADPKKGPLWLDGGDLFFTSLGLSEERLASEKDKAALIAATYKKWGVAAMTPGPKDLAGGPQALRELATAANLKVVSASLADSTGTLLFEPFVIKENQGVKFGIVGISGEGTFAHVPNVKVLPAQQVLNAAIKKAREQGATTVIVLSQSGLEADKKMAEPSGADFWLSAAATDNLKEPLQLGKTKLMEILPWGQQIAVLRLEGANSRYEAIDVKQSFAQDRAIQRGVDSLKKKRAAAELKSTATPKSGAAFVANYETCRGCHAKQVEFWEGTKHASAYLVLYSKNQHFDAECITCHTLGFKQDPQFMKIAHPLVLKGVKEVAGQPFVEKMMAEIFAKAKVTGPIDSREQPEAFAKLKKEYHASLAELSSGGKLQKVFMGVQCEHCHGNRVGHPEKIRRIGKVKETSCRECHRPPNAGEFSPAMIPKVACPAR